MLVIFILLLAVVDATANTIDCYSFLVIVFCLMWLYLDYRGDHVG